MIKCPHCGKFNEMLSNSNIREINQLPPQMKSSLLHNRTCNKCNKHYDVSVSGDIVFTTKSR